MLEYDGSRGRRTILINRVADQIARRAPLKRVKVEKDGKLVDAWVQNRLDENTIAKAITRVKRRRAGQG